MKIERSSGILLHVTSLPAPYGIGDMGSSAYDFVDFLKNSGQKYWQLLPLNPTQQAYGNSPYSSPSAFAGNLLLISPEALIKDNLLNKDDLKGYTFDASHVQFDKVTKFKEEVLEKAFSRFSKKKILLTEYNEFCAKSASWLDDHALFVTLKAHFKGKGWTSWPEDIRDRKKQPLAKIRKELATGVEKEKFFQFLFFRQWQQLKDYCHQQEIKLIGDIPFYVNHDSADCWANTTYFKLDDEKMPVAVSGVPPDYFSETGQLWGTPVYDWKALEQNGFSWWLERLEQNLYLFDIVRLDHFRAFSAFWEVPAGDETAVNGKWKKCPGTKFFQAVKKLFPAMPFIAEDLGTLDQPVLTLRDRFKFPGMKVLLFGFGENMGENPYILHHHIPHCIVYTGTHDNNTVKGWFKSAGKDEKRHVKEYVGRSVNIKNIAEIMQRMALMSVAELVILPVQDVLGYGEEAIMNRPGTGSGNWTWRLLPGKLTKPVSEQLQILNIIYNR